MKYIAHILIYLFFSIYSYQTYAVEINDIQAITRDLELQHENINFLWEDFSIDASEIDTLIKKDFPDFQLTYSWTIFSQNPQSGLKLTTNFDSFGEKAIELNVFVNDEDEDQLVYSSDFKVFVYQKSIALLTSSTVDRTEIGKFKDAAEDAWIYVYTISDNSESYIYGDEIIASLDTYKANLKDNSDYITIWWEKEFLFSALSQIQSQATQSQEFNVVLISPYNATILKNYITNSVSWKNVIKSWFIIDESLKYQILKNPEKIENFKLQMDSNSYLYTELMETAKIPAYYFVSRFINELSNNGVRLTDIYIILLLPVFLTLVWVSKHFIWLSTLGTIIPVFLSILYIKIGIIFTLGVMAFLLVVNILLSKFISRYTLLYTPKVTFITIVNLIVFMWVFLLAKEFTSFNIPTDNIIYIIIFFIIAEKLISIITSKEFREYKKSFLGTILISLLCFSLLHFKGFLVFLTAYPEILIILIPFNFMLWRFTGLRITEYLRFREIVKSIEE